MRFRNEAELLAHRAATKDIVTESQLVQAGTVNLWSPGRIKKYLRKYDLGAGVTEHGRAKRRYLKKDVAKAKMELLATEPKNSEGVYTNPTLALLQAENSL